MNTGQCIVRLFQPRSTNTKPYEISNLKHGEVFLKYLNTMKIYNTIRSNFSKICQNNRVLRRIKCHLNEMPNQLKDHSVMCVKTWTRQCECISAQQIRKGQQIFCLYTKLWEEKALKEFFKVMRQRLLKHSKEFIISAIGVSLYDWENNSITDEEIIKHQYDFDYIKMLKDENFMCTCCNKRKAVNIENPEAPHCVCPGDRNGNNYKDNWVPYLERKDLKVWRRKKSSGIYEYKVYGKYSDVTALDFLKVQIDTAYRSKWDTTAVQLEVIETNAGSNSDIIYWEMLWPRLFSNRDYVFNRRYMVQENEKTLYLVNKGTQHPNYPATKDKYRIVDYYSCMVIRSTNERIDEPGIEFSLTYFDNPGVNLPSSITSWVAMAVMPDFLEKLRVAAKDYHDYCQKYGTKDVFDRVSKLNTQKEVEVEPPATICNEMSSDLDTKSNSYWRYIYPNYYFG